MSTTLGTFLSRKTTPEHLNIRSHGSSFHLLDSTEEKQTDPNMDESAGTILFQKIEDSLVAEMYCSKTISQIREHSVPSLLCIFHISRFLVLQPNLPLLEWSHHPPAKDALQSLMKRFPHDILSLSLSNWTTLFSDFPSQAWVQVLRVFCVQCEVVSASCKRELLGGDISETVLEDLSWNQYLALGMLCHMLHRDERNHKFLSRLFGSWLLLDKEFTSSRCSHVMHCLIANHTLLFQQMCLQHTNKASRATLSLTKTPSLLQMADKSFRRSMRWVGKSSNNSEDDTNADFLKVRDRVLSDVRDRPPRSRSSLERIYGKSPAPPPPPPNSTHPSTNHQPPPRHTTSPVLNHPSSAAAAGPLLTRPILPPPSPYQQHHTHHHHHTPPPLPKPAFVLKPSPSASSSSNNNNLSPNNGGVVSPPPHQKRVPPPRPQQQPHAPHTTQAALQASARRRGLSKETI